MTLPPGPYRRVMVMGPCGSGKSTVARRLGALLGLPVTHMDQLHHGPGWEPRLKADFEADLTAAAAAPEWIIDGNHFGLSQQRLDRADLVVMLDLPRRITFPRIVKRIVTGLGKVRPDSAPGCPERLDLGFLWYSWRWQSSKRPAWLTLLAPHRDRSIHLTSDAQVDAFLAGLQPSS